MPYTTVAVPGANLGPVMPCDRSTLSTTFPGSSGFCEARPTGAAVAFVDGREQRL